jgi:hypothetical protein
MSKWFFDQREAPIRENDMTPPISVTLRGVERKKAPQASSRSVKEE